MRFTNTEKRRQLATYKTYKITLAVTQRAMLNYLKCHAKLSDVPATSFVNYT